MSTKFNNHVVEFKPLFLFDFSEYFDAREDFLTFDDVEGYVVLGYSCDMNLDIRRMMSERRKLLMSKNPKLTFKGFRKGKEPLDMIVKHFGYNVFFIDIVLDFLECLSFEQSYLIERIVNISRVEWSGERLIVEMVVERFKDLDIKDSDYKGIEIEERDEVVGDVDIQNELDRMIKSRRTAVDKEGEIGSDDYVTFRYVAKVGEKDIDEETTLITDGSDSRWSKEFLDGFIGHKIGDEFEIDVKFDDSFANHVFAGKEVLFKIGIKKVQSIVTPEMNNEFCKKHYDVDDVDALKVKIQDMLLKNKKDANDEFYYTTIENKLIEICGERDLGVSDTFIFMEVDKRLNGYKKAYGDAFNKMAEREDDYKKFVDGLKEQVIKGIKVDVMLQMISNKEDIKVDGDDLIKLKEDMPNIQQAEGADGMVSFMRRKKTMDKIMFYGNKIKVGDVNE